jgi:imidazole glycerol-phosphate synthase subunit HisH
MIGILKYRAGNIASVSNALERLKADYTITDDIDELESCKAVLFPGVGHAASAMNDLQKKELDIWLKQTEKPVLGICLGMQLLYESTEEGNTRTLGLIPGRLSKFDSEKAKVPHMGWNQTEIVKTHPLLKTIKPEHYFYFVHSFYAPVNDYTLASCNYINTFAAVAARDNYMGVQFHPEKSGNVGSLLIQNFLDIVSYQISINSK